MKKQTILITCILVGLLLTGCNIVKVKVPDGATVEAGGITIYTSAWKSANAHGNAGVEATTSPTTDASLTGL